MRKRVNVELVKAEIIKQVTQPSSIYNILLTFDDEDGVNFNAMRHFAFTKYGIFYRVDRVDTVSDTLNIAFMDEDAFKAIPDTYIDWSNKKSYENIWCTYEKVHMTSDNIRMDAKEYQVKVSGEGTISLIPNKKFLYRVNFNDLMKSGKGEDDIYTIMNPNLSSYNCHLPFRVTSEFLHDLESIEFDNNILVRLKPILVERATGILNSRFDSIIPLWADVFSDTYNETKNLKPSK